MKVLIKEKLSPHKSKTPEGYLICRDAVLARTGTQDYYATELYPNWKDEDKVISVMRKPEEVFSEETIASFENKPVTCEHPDEDVTPENYKDYSVGFARDIRRSKVNGEDVLVGNLIITDSDIINDIENGIRTELSCGYNCDITDGDNPQQINIRGNHIALCEKGRAGNAKIVDSIVDSNKLPADMQRALSKYLASRSKRTGDVDIIDLISDIEEYMGSIGKPIKLIREKIEGWYKTDAGDMKKDYIFSIDGYDNHILISLYANPENYDVFEVNGYFMDSKEEPYTKYLKAIEDLAFAARSDVENATDREKALLDIYARLDTLVHNSQGPRQDIAVQMANGIIERLKKTFKLKGKGMTSFQVKDELVKSGSDKAFAKNVRTEIKAGKDPKQAVAIAYSIKEQNDAIEDDFSGEIIDEEPTFDTYRGYDIEIDPDGYYILDIENFPILFESHDEAIKYIDEYLEKASSMIRDYAIRTKDMEFPELEEEITEEISNKLDEIKEEEEPEEEAAKRPFIKTKKSFLEELKEQLRNAE